MKLPVFKAFFAGLALLFSRAGELFKALWLPAMLLIAGNAYFEQQSMHKLAALSAIETGAENPAQIFTEMGSIYATMGFTYLVAAVFYPMMIAGNLKFIIRGQERRLPFYLQFGLDEFRILITIVLLAFMILLAEMAGGFGVVVIALVAATGGKTIAGYITLIAIVTLVIALIWFLLRMSLALPATIGARKIGIAETWRLTAGNAWRLFFYWILWGIVFIALDLIYIAAAIPGLLSMLPEMIAQAGQNPDSIQGAVEQSMKIQETLWDMSRPGFWLFAVGTYLFVLVFVAFSNIAGGVAYRYLADGESAQ